MARTFEENMNDKRLTVKSLRVLQDVEGSAFEQISAEIEKTNQSIASLQGVQDRYWASIADDNIISIEEKRALYKEKQTLDTEYSIVIQNAEKNKDYVDYSGLTEAYQNLNSYLAFIKLFENLGSNTKIDNRTEFYDAFDSYYIALNNVNQAILNKASVGDINVDKPDKITGVKAVASEKGIYVSFNQLSSEVKNNIGKYIYKLNKGDGVLHLFESQINGFTYEFDRLVDGFPEADDIKDWEWCVSAVSVYGKENEESNIATVNVDTYGTWIPNKDDINIIVSSNKRQITFSFNRIVTNKILYGQIQYGLLVQRIDIDGENFYTPALDKNPILSEENYKQETTAPLYVTSYFSQTVPLAGQNNKKWRKKYYETRENEDGTKSDSVSYSDTLPAYPDNAVITYDDKGNIIGVSYNDTVETFTQHYEYTLVDMPSPVDTTYKYKIDVWNKDTDLHYDILNSLAVIATANSAFDLVDNAITQNALAPDAVTADKIAAAAISAEKIAAVDILAKGARAGIVSTEGLIVDNSAFLASKSLPYKWTDPETNEEKTYIANPGEFFVGNSPDVKDNRDIVDFLHYLPGVGFWFKIKNFIVKGIATIIQNVFRVKKSGVEDSESFFTVNSTDKMDEATFTPARTVNVKGQLLSEKIMSPKISLKPNIYESLKNIKINEKPAYQNKNVLFINDLVNVFSDDFLDTNIIHSASGLEGVIRENSKVIMFGDYYVPGTINTYYNIIIWQNGIIENLVFLGRNIITNLKPYKNGYVAILNVQSLYFTEDFISSEKLISGYFYNSCLEVIDDYIFISSWIGEYNEDNEYILDCYLYFSLDGISFSVKKINFVISKLFCIDKNLFALEQTETGINIYKWDFDSENFNLVISSDGFAVNDFIYDETSQKLYAMKEKLIIFDGTSFTEEEFLPEFSKKLIAISKTHYLFMDIENNEYLSVKRDDKFLPIISDEDVTELNTFSAKHIKKLFSEALESIYPVGIIIDLAIEINPEEFFGGYWIKIKDRFILAAGDTYKLGDTGGSATRSLSVNNMPSHSHTITHNHSASAYTANTYIAALTGSYGAPSLNANTKTNYQLNFDSRTVYVTVNQHTGSSGSSGSGTAFSMLPPYLVANKWQRIAVKYKLSFDGNGGIGEIASIMEQPNVSITIPANIFTKEGYRFVCWNTSPDGTGTNYSAGVSISLSENTTLYAIWEVDVHIAAGTYTPRAFKDLIAQYISINGSRTVRNSFTVTVNSQSITVAAGATIYYKTAYDNSLSVVGFGSVSISHPSIASSFTYNKTFALSCTDFSGAAMYLNNYLNYSITVGYITFN